ncbi:hypothetical protein ACPSM1_08585 [Micromonospora chersina]|uniref:hypothetical protein n=1 Tax=Micromonospora chersina TaxID=47854 RepID=UPI003CA40AE6
MRDRAEPSPQLPGGDAEQPLAGGRLTAGVVRVGDTVRRPASPASGFVARLLAHLAGVCGAEWPCQPARLSLLVEYRGDRTGLLLYLGGLMTEAGEQLARLNPDHVPDLHHRFLGWARARG